MKTTPYLFFGGACTEAVEFYRDALGADIKALIRFGDLPGAADDTAGRVMHAELAVGDSTIFASDGQDQCRRAGSRRCRLGPVSTD